MFTFKSKPKRTQQEVIEEIHNSFNTAGDKLYATAMSIINETGEDILKKAERLKRLGFTSATDVKKSDRVRISVKMANSIQYYRSKYPNNKFITKEQVMEICKKYNLQCAPIDRYEGFVPSSKLDLIENFRCNDNDFADQIISNVKYEYPIGQYWQIKQIKKLYPDGQIPDSLRSGDRLYVSGQTAVNMESYDKINVRNMFICAPASDLNLKGLKKTGAMFSSFTHIECPDPVVLQPVKDGYLIVAAWGDEASDPIVVNETMN